MNLDYFTRSVRRRITWGFGLFVALAMATVAVTVGLRLYSTISANLTHELEERGKHDARLLIQRIEYLLESANALVTNPLVINGLNDAQGRQTYLPDLVKNFRDGRDVHAVALLAYDGKPVYSSLDTLPTYGDSPQLRSALANGVVSYLTDAAQGHWVVFVPVNYYNTTQGALVVLFDLGAVARRVIPGDALVGHRLLLGDKLLYASETETVAGDLMLAHQNVVSNSHGFLADLNLQLEVTAPRQHYLKPANSALLDVAVLGFLLTLAAIAMASWLGFSISRPILLLRQRVAEADGTPEKRCAPLGTHDELEDLAQKFDERTADLWEIQQHLEDLVARRTRELELAKEAAEGASRFKSSFLANMSHEIRTPMNAIVGFAHLLRRGSADPQQVDQLDKILQAAQHLLALINDILDFSKIEAGKLDMELADFDLEQVFCNLRDLVGAPAAEKGLQLSTRIDPAIPRILRGDSTRISQVLVNFASNAVKFTEAGGSVSLVVSLLGREGEKARLRFEVSDTGIGLSEEQLGRLFQAFEQADASTTRRFGGTGLGLAICKRLVQLMDGRIGVESSVGQGSTFWFELPLQEGSAERIQAAAHPGPGELSSLHGSAPGVAKSLQGRRVLLVEDNIVNQEVALTLLEEFGLVVDVANDGLQALEKAPGGHYDLILMDVQMPKLDGMAATRELRKMPGLASIPILAMTANAFNEDRNACLEAGMNDHVPKPVDPGRLCSALVRWLPAGAGGATGCGENVAPGQPQSGQGREDEVLRAALGAIDGLDLAAGLHIVRGKLPVYRRLLGIFTETSRDAAAKIGQALDAGDFAEARYLAHSLKGSAANLGLQKVRRLAGIIEAQTRENNTEGLEPARDAWIGLATELPLLLERLAGLPGLTELPASPTEPDASPPPGPESETAAILDELLRLLGEDDMGAQRYFASNRPALTALLGAEPAASLALHIENFAFGEALETLAATRRLVAKAS